MKKFLNFRPAFYLAVYICLGIVSACLFRYKGIVAGLSLTVFSALILVLFYFKYKSKTVFIRNCIFISLAVMIFALGFVLFTVSVNNFDNASHNNHFFTVNGRISQTYQTESGNYYLLSNVDLKGYVNEKTNYKVAVYVVGFTDYDIGDVIEYKSYLYDRASLYENTFRGDSVAKGIKYYSNINSGDITLISKSPTVFENVNLFIRDTLKSSLDNEEFTVAYALTTGNSDFIDEEIITNFRSAGVGHIFAVSGLHIGFLAFALSALFNRLRMNKIVQTVIILAVLIFYSGVCNFTASSIRATIMCAVLLIAKAFGFKYDGLSSIGISAIIILCISPAELFCVGFQLSFTVVLGIILLSGPISKIFKFLPRKISSALGVVISAQIAGIPICIATFGGFSAIAIIANLLFIPIVGALYIFIILATLLGGAFGIGYITLFPANYVLKLIIILIKAFDYTVFMVGGFTLAGFIIFFYASAFFCSDLINLKTRVKSVLIIFFACVFALGVVGYNVSEHKKTKGYVIGSNTLCASVISATKNFVIVNYAYDNFSTTRLKRAVGENIDNLIIVDNTASFDVSHLLTRFNYAFKISNVYTDCVLSSQLKTGLEKSFPDIVFNFCGKEDIIKKEITLTFCCNGYAVYMHEFGGFLFMGNGSHLGDYLQFSGLSYAVATNNELNIFKTCEFKLPISYRQNNAYVNAETYGNYEINFG